MILLSYARAFSQPFVVIKSLVSLIQDIEEKGVKLRLTVVDTPGFGDLLEGDDSWKACVKYVDDQFAAFFDVRRRHICNTTATVNAFHRTTRLHHFAAFFREKVV